MTSVAVAVNGGAGFGGKGSRRAVRWAVQNLLPKADRFILVHVIPTVTAVPTPSGGKIPVEELDDRLVALYVEELKLKVAEIFVPFKQLCKTNKMETLVLEGENPAAALVRHVSESGISSLVLGSWSPSCIIRKLKGPGVPASVLKSAPETCDIHVVFKYKVLLKSIASISPIVISSKRMIFNLRDSKKSYNGVSKQVSESCSSFQELKVWESFGASTTSNPSTLDTREFQHMDSSENVNKGVGRPHVDLGDSMIHAKGFNSPASTKTDQVNKGVGRPHVHLGDSMIHAKGFNSPASTKTDQSVQSEVEQLRLELQSTISMYKRACEELVHSQNKVQTLSSECVEEARRVNAALEREETLRKIAAEENARYVQVRKEVEEAKNLLAKETYEREMAELKAQNESSEKQRIVDALFLSDTRYKRYTMDEIQVATGFLLESNLIGSGGYGKVYKGSLDHTPVAIKILEPGAANKKEEFLREVEVLSHLHHPHLVLLLGACPESGCLVYEYLENGSLEDCIFHLNGKPRLPWFVRFRILFEVACGLSFLHNSKPEPIVHRDLKPGNILLDRNYVSKIGDVGLAKLMSDMVSDSVTEYRDSMVAGTLYYMDPEYARTGIVRPKSDLYAFGVLVLQVLTARRPNGLLWTAENAIKKGSLADILDGSVTDWPLAETEELAQLALKCSKLRCRERPDLDSEVLPALKRLVDVAVASVRVERSNIYAPSHYFCPILQDIMNDPYITADGFTYEHLAIKAWLDKHNVSPVTKLKLENTILTPNHTLRSAIQEWMSRVNFQAP